MRHKIDLDSRRSLIRSLQAPQVEQLALAAWVAPLEMPQGPLCIDSLRAPERRRCKAGGENWRTTGLFLKKVVFPSQATSTRLLAMCGRMASMGKALTAVYDGKVLTPDEPLDVAPNTRVRLRIESPTHDKSGAGKKKSFLETARSLKLEGPPDWSARLEDYLYGGKT